VRTHLSEKAFARGLCGGVFTTSIPRASQDRVEGLGELPGPVADQEPEPGRALP
jgi:hypothetical protein